MSVNKGNVNWHSIHIISALKTLTAGPHRAQWHYYNNKQFVLHNRHKYKSQLLFRTTAFKDNGISVMFSSDNIRSSYLKFYTSKSDESHEYECIVFNIHITGTYNFTWLAVSFVAASIKASLFLKQE